MKIALSSWSLRGHIGREFDITEFPCVAAEEFGIHAVEICQPHLARQDALYLDRLLGNLKASGTKLANLPIGVGNVSNLDSKKRRHDIRVVQTWMDVAAYLGAPSVRINMGEQVDAYDFGVTVDSFSELCDYATPLGLRIVLENHGGISGDPKKILQLIDTIGTDTIGTCPDFGNFESATRYEDLRLLAPCAFVCHAKTLNFDDQGDVIEFDFRKCMEIVQKSGFDGYFSIEFEGDGDQYEGVRKSLGLLHRYWTNTR